MKQIQLEIVCLFMFFILLPPIQSPLSPLARCYIRAKGQKEKKMLIFLSIPLHHSTGKFILILFGWTLFPFSSFSPHEH